MQSLFKEFTSVHLLYRGSSILCTVFPKLMIFIWKLTPPPIPSRGPAKTFSNAKEAVEGSGDLPKTTYMSTGGIYLQPNKNGRPLLGSSISIFSILDECCRHVFHYCLARCVISQEDPQKRGTALIIINSIYSIDAKYQGYQEYMKLIRHASREKRP